MRKITPAAQSVANGPIRSVKFHRAEDGFVASVKYAVAVGGLCKVFVKADTLKELLEKISAEVLAQGVAGEPIER